MEESSEELQYEELEPIARSEVERLLRTPSEATRLALLRLAWNDPDWRYVQNICLPLLEHPDPFIRTGAAWGIRTLAAPRGEVSGREVRPVLRRLAEGGDPDIIEALEEVEHRLFLNKRDALEEQRPLDAVYLGLLWSVAQLNSDILQLQVEVERAFGFEDETGIDQTRQVVVDVVLRGVVDVRRRTSRDTSEPVNVDDALVALDDPAEWEDRMMGSGELELHGNDKSRALGRVLGISEEMEIVRAVHDAFPLHER